MKFALVSEPSQKWENYVAIFKQNYTIELFYCFLNGLLLLFHVL